ncbi:MAG: hypothetical protein ACI883_001497, partial [Candidatus Azotimanducaceae bacterium]
MRQFRPIYAYSFRDRGCGGYNGSRLKKNILKKQYRQQRKQYYFDLM